MYMIAMTDAVAGIPLPLPIAGLVESPDAGASGGPTIGMGPWVMLPPTAPASGIFESDAGIGGVENANNTFFLLIFMTQPVVVVPDDAVHAGICFSIVSMPELEIV
jgi:hypothetical protein